MSDYRVNLEVYNGPLDLLLYLIRREEVDIYDIPIARVTQQYLGYVELLQAMDPNLAGDFLVMAATLMEIKTRMLLPTPPVEEGEASDLEIDPRAELVRQLLEYKAFKDAAGDLRDAAETQAQMFPRKPVLPDAGEREVDIEDVQVWDLFEAFNSILEAIGADKPSHQVIYDDTPIELHAEDILDRLGREGPLTFRKVFEGRTKRTELLGLFLAVLELVRLKKIITRQDRNFGDINIALNPNAPEQTETTQDHALTAANLDIESRSEEEQDMLTQDTSEDRAAAAAEGDLRPYSTEVVDQESDDEEEFDDEDLDEEFDDDDDFDDDFDDDDEDWEDEPEDSVRPDVSASAEQGQYIADTHVSLGGDDDSAATTG